MERFQQLLKESFSTPYYRWDWDVMDDDNWEASFRTKDGDHVEVHFENDIPGDGDIPGEEYLGGEWYLAYGIPGADNEYGRTHKFDALNVFGTVIDITRKFIRAVEPDVLEFSGSAETGLDKFYKKVMQKFKNDMGRDGYRATFRDTVHGASFKLTKV